MTRPRTTSQRGFTLLELLVAIAIFAVVGALALSGYTQLQKQSEYAEQRLDRTREVQRAVQTLAQDLEQVEPRAIREPLGDAQLPRGAGRRLDRNTRCSSRGPAGATRPACRGRRCSASATGSTRTGSGATTGPCSTARSRSSRCARSC